MSDEIVFAVSTGFGARERQPYVQILIEAADWVTQMPPATARELAMNLLQAAEAAEGDGFLMHFVQNVIGVSEPHQQAALLQEFRDYREKRREEATTE